MSKPEIIAELLKVISDSQAVSDMSYSTGKELIKLVRMLQVV